MSRALKCDICGKLYELDKRNMHQIPGHIGVSDVYSSIVLATAGGNQQCYWDVCDECADEFSDWYHKCKTRELRKEDESDEQSI